MFLDQSVRTYLVNPDLLICFNTSFDNFMKIFSTTSWINQEISQFDHTQLKRKKGGMLCKPLEFHVSYEGCPDADGQLAWACFFFILLKYLVI